ncbi:MAG: UDP-N-acetylglucosamine 2-epimerase (non-hydrolyzing) [Saprospiraceae bacterium]|nr:UDP-N-acetylglucosamine 2-epimerase (non-hydrolyzing) [Saprospiraceae bacterium]
MKKVYAIIGARPQFIKHAPIELASKGKFELKTIHTGQHYDYKMSQVFFEELGISQPDHILQAGGGTHGEMTGKMLMEIEKILMAENPDMVLVYGDTNSTLAGALSAAKLNIPVIHIEAGLRSFNRSMPEEINRLMTDHLSSILFAPTDTAIANLKTEGITQGVYKTGDVMCDMIRIAKERNILKDSSENFIYMTLHRPYNTDDLDRLYQILDALQDLSIPVKFFAHPRSRQRLSSENHQKNWPKLQIEEPLSYFDNLNAMHQSKCIITDSGGIQKEAYILRKKCITLRSETEWTETLRGGWNQLIWEDLDRLKAAVESVPGSYIEGIYGDGRGADEIVERICSAFI